MFWSIERLIARCDILDRVIEKKPILPPLFLMLGFFCFRHLLAKKVKWWVTPCGILEVMFAWYRVRRYLSCSHHAVVQRCEGGGQLRASRVANLSILRVLRIRQRASREQRAKDRISLSCVNMSGPLGLLERSRLMVLVRY